MNTARALEKLAADPVKLAIGVAVVLGVVYLLGRAAIKETAGAIGGLVSGDNSITAGTPYQGAGIAGTLGAATNAASGGLLERFGSWLGGKAADLFQGDAEVASNLRAEYLLAKRRGAPPDVIAFYEQRLGIGG